MSALAKGIMEMATSPVAPITLAREGAALPAYVEARVRLADIGITQFGSPQIEGQQPHGIADAIPHFREVRKQAAIRRLLKQYPDLDQLVDDMTRAVSIPDIFRLRSRGYEQQQRRTEEASGRGQS
jgi:hypothetical protein